MVTITITLEHRHHAWFVVECEIWEHATSSRLHPLPTRQFMSRLAATNYVKRLVLGRLKVVKHDATGADIACRVELRMTDERQRRA